MDSTFYPVLGSYDQSISPLCSEKGEEFHGQLSYCHFVSIGVLLQVVS
jgi:hypothetical protein